MAGETDGGERSTEALKEDWIQNVADLLYAADERLTHRDDAVSAARWGSAWVDAYQERTTEAPPVSIEEAELVMRETQWITSGVLPAYLKYPNGTPEHRITSAAVETFSLAFLTKETRMMVRGIFRNDLAVDLAHRLGVRYY